MEYRGVLQGNSGNCGGTVGYYRYCRVLGVLQGIVGYCWALGGIGGYWRVLCEYYKGTEGTLGYPRVLASTTRYCMERQSTGGHNGVLSLKFPQNLQYPTETLVHPVPLVLLTCTPHHSTPQHPAVPPSALNYVLVPHSTLQNTMQHP